MPYIIFFFKIRMTFLLVAMTGLEKCCITSAYLQWLCHSGERPMARGPLVLFSSAAYLCLQQESMSVAALSRLLEAVANLIKLTTLSMSTILATEIFQTRRDAALAYSKLLLENSSYELRNASINSKTLFDGKIKEGAKANYEAQQQRF